MPQVEFAPAAERDLIAIGDYIASDDPRRALSFVEELVERTRAIAERPFTFPARDDLVPGLRVARHGRYLLFFTPSATTVRIERVLHAARDVETIFDEGG